MSTIATSINSSATIVLTDFAKRLSKKELSEKKSMRVLYATSFVVGALGIVMGLLMMRIDGVLDAFYRVRDLRGLQKKPSTSEVLDWIQALVIGGVPVEKLEKEIPFAGVLLKKTEDLKLVENNRYVY